MDYQITLYNPIYMVSGVAATLVLVDGTTIAGLTALDKTSGIDTSVGDATAQTIKPAAALRMVELRSRGVEAKQTPGALITLNDEQWKVMSYRMRPSPKGENDGEIYLILSGRRSVESESESE